MKKILLFLLICLIPFVSASTYELSALMDGTIGDDGTGGGSTNPPPEDRYEEIQSIPLDLNLILDSNYSFSGEEISNSSDVDYFRFEVVDSSKFVKVYLENIPSGKNYDIELFKENTMDGPKLFIKGSYNTGSSNEYIAYSLSTGVYYLKVWSQSNDYSNQNYKLRMGNMSFITPIVQDLDYSDMAVPLGNNQYKLPIDTQVINAALCSSLGSQYVQTDMDPTGVFHENNYTTAIDKPYTYQTQYYTYIYQRVLIGPDYHKVYAISRTCEYYKVQDQVTINLVDYPDTVFKVTYDFTLTTGLPTTSIQTSYYIPISLIHSKLNEEYDDFVEEIDGIDPWITVPSLGVTGIGALTAATKTGLAALIGSTATYGGLMILYIGVMSEYENDIFEDFIQDVLDPANANKHVIITINDSCSDIGIGYENICNSIDMVISDSYTLSFQNDGGQYPDYYYTIEARKGIHVDDIIRRYIDAQ